MLKKTLKKKRKLCFRCELILLGLILEYKWALVVLKERSLNLALKGQANPVNLVNLKTQKQLRKNPSKEPVDSS